MVIRYPGSKGKLAQRLVSVISKYLEERDVCYVEPFFGAGAIGLRLLSKPFVKRVWFNDIDPGIFSLWKSVQYYPELLIQRINDFNPCVERFYEYKKELLEIKSANFLSPVTETYVDIGFKKLVVHQLSYSGLGTKSGGPLGGADQKSDYKVDCRWSPKQLKKEILRLNTLFREKMYVKQEIAKLNDGYPVTHTRYEEGATITSLSYVELLTGPAADCFIYLDPPYYVKGPELYQFSFTDEDHERLANLLSLNDSPWLLSYDDCPKIRSLYSYAAMREVPLNYTINGATTKTELLIAPRKYEFLLEEQKKRTFDMFEDG